ncbi:MAG: ABC transporter permease [Actinomycetota bacterium]
MSGLFRWDYVWSHLDDIGTQTVEHLKLTFLAVAIGLLISGPLALLAFRYRWTYPPITWVTGILYTIPSLAVFAFLRAYTGLTTLTAVIPLVSYTLLILIRNIVAGLRAVPADVKEAARGMGLRERQLLWKVELPLALPVIAAGIRIATVTTVGLVTVSAIVGQGGVGLFILRGIRSQASTLTLLGAGLAIIIATVLDLLLLVAERKLVPWARKSAG